MESRNENSKITLHEAVSTQDIKNLKSLLADEKCININQLAEDQLTALHLATRIGNKTIVKLLLEKGANMHLKDGKGKNPLHIAAGSKNHNIVKLFLAKGMNVNVPTKSKLMPLHIAVKNDDIHLVKLLLQNNAKVNTQNSTGDSPLHDAVKYGSINLIKLLLDHKADPNCTNNSRESAFHASLKDGSDSAIALLLKYGASPQLKNDSGENALHLACKFGSEEVVKSLLDMNLNSSERTLDRSTPLHYAVRNRYVNAFAQIYIIRLLLNTGADLEAEDKRGKTALSLAAENEPRSACFFSRVVNYLLSVGANPKGVDPDRLLIHAVQNSSTEICRMLLDKGANVDSRCCDGDRSTALHLAIAQKHNPLVDLLIAKNASIHLRNTFGCTPLLMAVGSSNFHVVRVLLELGANVNDRCMHNESVLALAIYDNNEEMVRLLLDSNAEVDGNKSVHVAAEHSNVNVMKMLLERGANLEALDENGLSILEKAIVTDNCKMLSYLLHIEMDTRVRLANGLFRLVPGIGTPGTANLTLLAILLKHTALAKARNLHVDEQDVNYISADEWLSTAYESFCREAESLKSQKVCEATSSVTYFDVLTKRHVGLARCLRSEWVRAALSSDEHKTRFPHYGDLIEYNFRDGLKLWETMERHQRLLHQILGTLLPYDITCMIAEYV